MGALQKPQLLIFYLFYLYFSYDCWLSLHNPVAATPACRVMPGYKKINAKKGEGKKKKAKQVGNKWYWDSWQNYPCLALVGLWQPFGTLWNNFSCWQAKHSTWHRSCTNVYNICKVGIVHPFLTFHWFATENPQKCKHELWRILTGETLQPNIMKI